MFRPVVVAMAIMGCSYISQAEEPKLILEGNSPAIEYRATEFNRIYFNDKSLTLASQTGLMDHSVVWDYSRYNVLKFDFAENSIEDMECTDRDLVYKPDNLILTGADSISFRCAVYNMAGVVISTGEFRADGTYSITTLLPGVYFAVASDGNRQLTLGFVIK